jgi:beta-ureidopropionase
MMSRVVRAALIQAHANLAKQEALDKHVALLEQAAAQGAEVACLQEIFFGPYFCGQQEPRWFETAEPDDGQTVRTMQQFAQASARLGRPVF